MVTYCCVRGCRNTSKNYKLRIFPKDPILFAKWIKLVDREDLLYKGIKKIRAVHLVCDAHFRDEDRFPENRNRSNLKKFVVPSLFLNKSESTSDPIPIEVICPPPQSIDLPINIESSADSDSESTSDPIPIEVICPPPQSIDLPITIETSAISESVEIDTRCRVCLEYYDEGVPLNTITNMDGEPRTLYEILNMYTVIKICDGDGGPQTMCVDCVERARAAYEFNISCRKSQIKLQKEKENLKSSCQPVVEKIKIKENNSGNQSISTTRVKTTTSTKKVINRKRKYNKTICVQCRKHFYKHSRHKLFKHVCIGVKNYFCKLCGARYALFRNFSLHQHYHTANDQMEIS